MTALKLNLISLLILTLLGCSTGTPPVTPALGIASENKKATVQPRVDQELAVNSLDTPTLSPTIPALEVTDQPDVNPDLTFSPPTPTPTSIPEDASIDVPEDDIQLSIPSTPDFTVEVYKYNSMNLVEAVEELLRSTGSPEENIPAHLETFKNNLASAEDPVSAFKSSFVVNEILVDHFIFLTGISRVPTADPNISKLPIATPVTVPTPVAIPTATMMPTPVAIPTATMMPTPTDGPIHTPPPPGPTNTPVNPTATPIPTPEVLIVDYEISEAIQCEVVNTCPASQKKIYVLVELKNLSNHWASVGLNGKHYNDSGIIIRDYNWMARQLPPNENSITFLILDTYQPDYMPDSSKIEISQTFLGHPQGDPIVIEEQAFLAMDENNTITNSSNDEITLFRKQAVEYALTNPGHPNPPYFTKYPDVNTAIIWSAPVGVVIPPQSQVYHYSFNQECVPGFNNVVVDLQSLPGEHADNPEQFLRCISKPLWFLTFGP